jgi:hypothetical protein
LRFAFAVCGIFLVAIAVYGSPSGGSLAAGEFVPGVYTAGYYGDGSKHGLFLIYRLY